MNLDKPNPIIRKMHSVAAVFATFAGLFLIWIEEAFVRSWSNDRWMYFPALVSAVATLCLLVSFLPFADLHKLRLRIASSGLLVFAVACFLIEIIPIATGNNDSGEVFWIVALPAILLSIYFYFSYLKIHEIKRKEVTPCPQ